MRKRHAHIADGMKYHSNWYRNRTMGYCRKYKCHNDDIITITTTWSPKIALALGNYIVNQVGNLCRGHPDERIPHFEASCSCVQKKVHAKKKYVSDCIFKKFWDISWNFPAGFHHHIGLHHINMRLDINILNHINIVHIPTKWFIASPIFRQLPGGNPRTAAIMRRRYEKKGTGWTSRDECARWMFGG